MSLLEKFEEMHRRIIALERLVGVTGEESEQAWTVAGDEASVVPWYHNIPKEGVECWVEDTEGYVRAERDKACEDTAIVYSYDSTVIRRFGAEGRLSWKYAIPVDPNLRLPDGEIVL
jgi:hypothetical protein